MADENETVMLSRVKMMTADEGQTWDLSPRDRVALRYVLTTLARLTADLAAVTSDRDMWRSECESISAELDLPPGIRPAEGELRRMLDHSRTLLAQVTTLTAERDALQRHFDAAAPEHNLPALLDLYFERQQKAEKERDRLVANATSGYDETGKCRACGGAGQHDSNRPCGECEGGRMPALADAECSERVERRRADNAVAAAAEIGGVLDVIERNLRATKYETIHAATTDLLDLIRVGRQSARACYGADMPQLVTVMTALRKAEAECSEANAMLRDVLNGDAVEPYGLIERITRHLEDK